MYLREKYLNVRFIFRLMLRTTHFPCFAFVGHDSFHPFSRQLGAGEHKRLLPRPLCCEADSRVFETQG